SDLESTIEKDWLSLKDTYLDLRPPPSDFAALCVPMLLKISHQCRAEVAIGLFADIDREIVQKHVERLLRHAKPAPVGHGAHHAGTREAVDDARSQESPIAAEDCNR